MTIILPKPPVGIDEATARYLRELVQVIELEINNLAQNYQKKGDPVILPRVTVADITANPGLYRAGQEGRAGKLLDEIPLSFDQRPHEVVRQGRYKGFKFRLLPIGDHHMPQAQLVATGL